MSCPRRTGVGLNTLRTEPDSTTAKAASLALDLQESSLAFQHQVIPLVHSKGKKNAITAPHELSEDRALGAMPNIDRMIRENGRFQTRTHVRNVDKTSDVLRQAERIEGD
jgi:hypothetical protein